MTTFTPMTIQRLAAHVADEADADRRWSLLVEFLEERAGAGEVTQVLQHRPQAAEVPGTSGWLPPYAASSIARARSWRVRAARGRPGPSARWPGC